MENEKIVKEIRRDINIKISEVNDEFVRISSTLEDIKEYIDVLSNSLIDTQGLIKYKTDMVSRDLDRLAEKLSDMPSRQADATLENKIKRSRVVINMREDAVGLEGIDLLD